MYIYVTEEDELISLTDLPPLLGLFEAEASWRWSNKVISCHNVSKDSLTQAEVILGIYGYHRKEVDERLLERYFAEGDKDFLLSKKGKATLTVIPKDQGLSRRKKGTERTPIEEPCTAEAELTTVLSKLEVAHRERRLKEDVYMQEREIAEEKLKAYRREGSCRKTGSRKNHRSVLQRTEDRR